MAGNRRANFNIDWAANRPRVLRLSWMKDAAHSMLDRRWAGAGGGHCESFAPRVCLSLWHVKSSSRATGAVHSRRASQLAALKVGGLEARFVAHVLPFGRGKNRCRAWSAPVPMDGELWGLGMPWAKEAFVHMTLSSPLQRQVPRSGIVKYQTTPTDRPPLSPQIACSTPMHKEPGPPIFSAVRLRP